MLYLYKTLDRHSTITTPRSTPFPALFVIISDSKDEITSSPVRPIPPSPDCTPALYNYPLDSGNDSSDEDMIASPSTCHPLLPSEIPSLSSPPSLLTSSSSSPPSLLPSLSHKRSTSPSPSLPSSVSPSPPPTAAPPPTKHIK
ncbi:hypothetical protein Tco_0733895 [Tanacetum coccineum]